MYLFEWGSLLPPFYRFGVFLICGFEFVSSSITMAIAQKFYEMSTILFPIAMMIFDDTKERGLPNFVWTSNERNILKMHEQKLLLLWCTSTASVFTSMALMIPCFFQFSPPKSDLQRQIRAFLAYLFATLFIIVVLINGIVILWLHMSVPAENELFYDLFNSAVKEEIFLTEIEKSLDCSSDDDKELHPSMECDNLINRSVISRRWLKNMATCWICGHVLVVFMFGFANKDFKCGDEDSETGTNEKLLSQSR